MSRLELAKIHALTFYQDTLTASRRTDPLPQLICVGKPCRRYTPDVVRCVNLGGVGTEIDWKCEADLPESLRFGRVEISCEGWSKPGDPHILKGSCSLEYRLVDIQNSYSQGNWFQSTGIAERIFMFIWIAFLVFTILSVITSCFHRIRQPGNTSHPNRRPGGNGSFPGGPRDDYDAPPPYSQSNANQGWRPGFWTGTALGGLGSYFMNNRRPEVYTDRWSSPWDWEGRLLRRPIFGRRRVSPSSEDRGEGTSSVGATRRSTGLGGTTVR